MKLWAAVKVCFKDFFRISRRASRSEYWYFMLFAYVVMPVLFGAISGIYYLISGSSSEAMGLFSIILTLFFLIALIPLCCVGVRRFHDINRTGWHFLGCNILGALPIVQFFALPVLWYWLCRSGDRGQNKFGKPYKLQTT